MVEQKLSKILFNPFSHWERIMGQTLWVFGLYENEFGIISKNDSLSHIFSHHWPLMKYLGQEVTLKRESEY